MSGLVIPESWPVQFRERVEAAPDGLSRAALVARLVSKYSKSLNITGSDETRMWAQIGEAIAALLAVESALDRRLRANDTWVDIGSGGGFPGLVLAALAEAEILLVEPREKRVAFLEVGMGSLRRRGAPVFRGRLAEAEVVGRDGERFGEVLSRRRELGGALIWGARAVFPPGEWVERAGLVMRADEFLVLHLREGLESPSRFVEASSTSFEQWRVAVGRPALSGESR